MTGKEESAWDGIPSLNLEMDDDYAERVSSKQKRRHSRSDFASLKKVLGEKASYLPIKLATTTCGYQKGVMLDLSESGCRLAASVQLKKGEQVKVGFIVHQRTIVSKAIVRWVSSKRRVFLLGLEFQGLPEDTREILKSISSAAKMNTIGKVQ